MSVYLKFEEGEDEQMSIALLKCKDGKLEEVNSENDVECNVYEMFGLVLFQLISVSDSKVNKLVFDSMQQFLDSLKEND